MENLSKEEIKRILEEKRQERKEEEEREFYKNKLKRELEKRRKEEQRKEEEKQRIKDELNEKRLLKQKYEEVERKRFEGKQLYTVRIFKAYKLYNSSSTYYLIEDNVKKIKTTGSKVELYRRNGGGYDKVMMLIKKEKKNENILISEDPIKIKYEIFKIEKKRKE